MAETLEETSSPFSSDNFNKVFFQYLIKNEYLENELIKLMFKVHLSSL